MSRRYSVEDWRNAVIKHHGISEQTRALLLVLADYMREDLTVSVPRPVLIRRFGWQDQASTFDRRINERLREAVGEKIEEDPEKRLRNLSIRLLDRKVTGRKHVTAVYQGLIPDLSQQDVPQPAEKSRKNAQQDVRQPAEKCSKRPAETHDPRSQQDVLGPASSREKPNRNRETQIPGGTSPTGQDKQRRTKGEQLPTPDAEPPAVDEHSRCAHGMPGGDLPDPWLPGGLLACPECRVESNRRERA